MGTVENDKTADMHTAGIQGPHLQKVRKKKVYDDQRKKTQLEQKGRQEPYLYRERTDQIHLHKVR